MKYRTIVADPPWPVANLLNRPWVMGAGGRRRRASVVPYQSMSLEDIYGLPVADLAEEDAHLYLWVTAEFNRNGIGVDCASAWGFRVVGEIIWMKPSYGLGAFPRPQHEILLVCRRGKLPFTRRDVGSVQRWNQTRHPNNGGKVHSAKPEASLDLVESNSPPPYLELFARRNRLRWHTWGDQVMNHVEMPS